MSQADNNKRASLIQRALQLSKQINAKGGERQGRAEGGEAPSMRDILAMKETNPRGWDADVKPEGYISSSLSPHADFIGGEYGPLAGRAYQGLMDAGDFGRSTALGLTGLDLAASAGEDIARGDYGHGAAEGALALAPFVRGPVSALAAAAKYAARPRVAAGIAGGLGLGAGMAESGPEDASPEAEIARMLAAKEKLVAARDAASQQFLSTSKETSDELSGKGKSGKGKGPGPISGALAEQGKAIQEQTNRYNTEIDRIDKRLGELQYQMTPAYKREQDLAQSNVEARKPWYERSGIPGVEHAANWAPWVGAAALANRGFGHIASEGDRLLDAVRAARAGGNARDEAAALIALDKWRKSAPFEYVKTGVEAAAVPGGIRTVGTVGDASFGPQVKDEKGNVLPGGAKEQAQEHLARMFGSEGWPGAAKEWGPLALSGAEATALGGASRAVFGKRPPMAEAAGETASLRGIERDPGLFGRKLSPEEIALEIARRRASIPASLSTSPTRLEPAWPQLMRGEPTSRAPSPLGESGPASPSSSILAGPDTSVPQRLLPPRAEVPPASTPGVSSSPAPASATPVRGKTKSKLLKHFKDDGVKKWKEPSGSIKHKDASGNYTSKPEKAKAASPEPAPEPEGMSAEDYLSDPTKLTGGMATGGGVFGRALGLARKYAQGGAVVGPVMGATGGRTDALPVSVPSGAYVLPSDVVSNVDGAEGNTNAGVAVLDRMFGRHRESRASGGGVPIKISDGEYVVAPEIVAALGNGDMDAGHRALDRFVLDTRQKHIATLKSLPPPAR